MRPLELADVARLPLPGTTAPAAFKASPSGTLLTYLHSEDASLSRQLYAFDVRTRSARLLFAADGGGVREEDLSLEEKLRRERARELGLGVTSYSWAEEADVLAIPLPGGVFVWRDGEVTKVVDDEAGALLDPRLSPDGSHLAFVQASELHVVNTDGSARARQLTRGARESGRTNGLAEFVAQEEMGRAEGYWWSPDGLALAYVEVDETHIPVYRIVHQGSDQVGASAEEDHRYPFAGCDNARVRLFVVGRDGGDPTELDLGDCEYLARVAWHGPDAVVAQLQNRLQDRLDVVRFDLRSGTREVLLTETSRTWVNLHDAFRPLRDGRFLWASERSGHRHLEVRGRDGSLVRTLTSGEWMVTSVEGVDEDRSRVWFTATIAGALERHLCEVGLDGDGEVRVLTREAGVHQATVAPSSGVFVDVFSSPDRPPTVTIRSLDDGAAVADIPFQPDPRLEDLELEPPDLVTITTRDGVTLDAAVYRPAGDGPFPLVLSVYGGPGVQRITRSWSVTVAMRAQLLRQRGYLVVACDNRGGHYRGKAFEDVVHGRLGEVEVRDQVDVVNHFVTAGDADPDRVGIYGWSYGGYLAAMCLAREPNVFRVAVAGAPVTAWDGYDTHYTERYMGTPEANPEGYAASSVMTHAHAITGRLQLVHGLIDENVHFRHTARLINALVAAGIDYELLLFPDERHSPRSEKDRVYMEERIFSALAASLAG